MEVNENPESVYSLSLVKNFFLVFSFLCINNSFSQVYNYTPIEIYNIETNPAILASKEKNNVFNCSQQNSFSSSNQFSTSNLSASKYLSKSFIGLGISANNTSLGKNKNYSHLGLGIGYRNVLFNKMNIKFGMTYKIIQSNSPKGHFDYFSFSPSDSINMSSNSTFSDNLNTSILLSDGYSKYYVSFAVLNLNTPWSNSVHNNFFPNYYAVNLGNFLNLFNVRFGNEVSYSGIFKSSPITNKTSVGHYLKISLHTKVLSRKSSIISGSSFGYIVNESYHFIPFITYYTKEYNLKLSYNCQFDKATLHQLSTSSFQLFFEYKLSKKSTSYHLKGDPSF